MSVRGRKTGLKDLNGKEIEDGYYIVHTQAPVNRIFKYDGEWCMENYHAGALPLKNYTLNGIFNGTIIGNMWDNTELDEGWCLDEDDDA